MFLVLGGAGYIGSHTVYALIEKGEDVVAGGAILNSGPHYMLTGVADLGDSLEVIKRLVFDDKQLDGRAFESSYS